MNSLLRFILFFAALFALIIMGVVGAVWVCEYRCDIRMQRLGDEVVAKVEKFRAEHGRLPVDLAEVGHTGDDLYLYYTASEDGTYVIRYSKGFDESGVFNPRERKWKAY